MGLGVIWGDASIAIVGQPFEGLLQGQMLRSRSNSLKHWENGSIQGPPASMIENILSI